MKKVVPNATPSLRQCNSQPPSPGARLRRSDRPRAPLSFRVVIKRGWASEHPPSRELLKGNASQRTGARFCIRGGRRPSQGLTAPFSLRAQGWVGPSLTLCCWDPIPAAGSWHTQLVLAEVVQGQEWLLGVVGEAARGRGLGGLLP